MACVARSSGELAGEFGFAVAAGSAFEWDGLQHERLGEEGAAYAGLLADGADAEGGEALGAEDAAAFEEEERGFFEMWLRLFSSGVAGWTMMARRWGMGRTISSARDWTDFTFCHWAWRAAAFSKLHAGGGFFAGEADVDDHGFAAGVEEFFYGGGFGGVLLGGAGLLAGLDALVHLAVDAAGVFGIGGEVFVAAAEFEEIEGGVAVALGGETRGEGAVHLREAAFGELVGGVDAGEFVVEGEAEEVGGVEFEAAAGFGVAEVGGGGVVEDEGGFEARSR